MLIASYHCSQKGPRLQLLLIQNSEWHNGMQIRPYRLVIPQHSVLYKSNKGVVVFVPSKLVNIMPPTLLNVYKLEGVLFHFLYVFITEKCLHIELQCVPSPVFQTSFSPFSAPRFSKPKNQNYHSLEDPPPTKSAGHPFVRLYYSSVLLYGNSLIPIKYSAECYFCMCRYILHHCMHDLDHPLVYRTIYFY